MSNGTLGEREGGRKGGERERERMHILFQILIHMLEKYSIFSQEKSPIL